MELWSGRPFVTIRNINGVDMVSASAELVSLFYSVSNRPASPMLTSQTITKAARVLSIISEPIVK